MNEKRENELRFFAYRLNARQADRLLRILDATEAMGYPISLTISGRMLEIGTDTEMYIIRDSLIEVLNK